MSKEFYTFEEARQILGMSKKVFSGARKRGEIITLGRRIAGAEIERVMGHPIGATTHVGSLEDEEAKKETALIAKGKRARELKLINDDIGFLADLPKIKTDINKQKKDAEKITQQANQHKHDVESECASIITKANTEIQKAGESLSNIQGQIDGKLKDAQNKADRIITDANNQAETVKKEATALMQSVNQREQLIGDADARYKWFIEHNSSCEEIVRTLNKMLHIINYYGRDFVDRGSSERFKLGDLIEKYKTLIKNLDVGTILKQYQDISR